MSITPQFKEELRQRIRLSDLIGKRVKVTRAGPEFKACCPFHSEKTPSFTINDQKHFYHCFGCGAHGDVITFLMQHDNLPFMEAIESLAAEAGMQVPKPTPEEQEKYKLYDRLLSCTQEATKWFMAQLHDLKNKEVKHYALARGLSEETLQKFRIGYAPSNRNALCEYLKEKGYSDREMVDASLARQDKKGEGVYAFFRDRLIFPVTDGRGRVVAFGGRILPEELREPERGDYVPAKYMNSSDTIIFHKGRMVFNESIARQAAGQGEPVLVTEGYMDVIALVQAGYHGAIAPLGTALTEDQIKLTWSMIAADVKEPYVCFDGDDAGRRAAERAVDRMLPMLSPGYSARFVFMPQGEDPDSLIKNKGKAAFEKLLAQALPMIDVVWQGLSEGQVFDTPERLAGLEKSINALCESITDKSVQYHYRNHLRERLRKLQFSQSNFTKKSPKSKVVDIRAPQARYNIQATLLYTLYQHPYLIGQFEENMASMRPMDAILEQCRDDLHGFYVEEEAPLTHEGFQKWLKDTSRFDSLADLALTHGAFLKNQDNPQIIEKAVKELLQNLVHHANFDLRKPKRLGDTAQVLLKTRDES